MNAAQEKAVGEEVDRLLKTSEWRAIRDAVTQQIYYAHSDGKTVVWDLFKYVAEAAFGMGVVDSHQRRVCRSSTMTIAQAQHNSTIEGASWNARSRGSAGGQRNPDGTPQAIAEVPRKLALRQLFEDPSSIWAHHDLNLLLLMANMNGEWLNAVPSMEEVLALPQDRHRYLLHKDSHGHGTSGISACSQSAVEMYTVYFTTNDMDCQPGVLRLTPWSVELYHVVGRANTSSSTSLMSSSAAWRPPSAMHSPLRNQTKPGRGAARLEQLELLQVWECQNGYDNNGGSNRRKSTKQEKMILCSNILLEICCATHIISLRPIITSSSSSGGKISHSSSLSAGIAVAFRIVGMGSHVPCVPIFVDLVKNLAKEKQQQQKEVRSKPVGYSMFRSHHNSTNDANVASSKKKTKFNEIWWKGEGGQQDDGEGHITVYSSDAALSSPMATTSKNTTNIHDIVVALNQTQKDKNMAIKKQTDGESAVENEIQVMQVISSCHRRGGSSQNLLHDHLLDFLNEYISKADFTARQESLRGGTKKEGGEEKKGISSTLVTKGGHSSPSLKSPHLLPHGKNASSQASKHFPSPVPSATSFLLQRRTSYTPLHRTNHGNTMNKKSEFVSTRLGKTRVSSSPPLTSGRQQSSPLPQRRSTSPSLTSSWYSPDKTTKMGRKSSPPVRPTSPTSPLTPRRTRTDDHTKPRQQRAQVMKDENISHTIFSPSDHMKRWERCVIYQDPNSLSVLQQVYAKALFGKQKQKTAVDIPHQHQDMEKEKQKRSTTPSNHRHHFARQTTHTSLDEDYSTRYRRNAQQSSNARLGVQVLVEKATQEATIGPVAAPVGSKHQRASPPRSSSQEVPLGNDEFEMELKNALLIEKHQKQEREQHNKKKAMTGQQNIHQNENGEGGEEDVSQLLEENERAIQQLLKIRAALDKELG